MSTQDRAKSKPLTNFKIKHSEKKNTLVINTILSETATKINWKKMYGTCGSKKRKKTYPPSFSPQTLCRLTTFIHWAWWYSGERLFVYEKKKHKTSTTNTTKTTHKNTKTKNTQKNLKDNTPIIF